MASYVAEKDLAILPHHPIRRERQMTEHWTPPPTQKEVEEWLRLVTDILRLIHAIHKLSDAIREMEIKPPRT